MATDAHPALAGQFGSRGVSKRQLLGGACAVFAAGALGGCASSQAQTPRERLRDRIQQRRAQQGAAAPSGASANVPVGDPRAAAGSQAVVVSENVWTDAARSGRSIPWRLYAPAQARASVAIFSHGGGGTREAAEQYGRHLASHGIASLHIQHAGSDRDAFRNDPQQISTAARDPAFGAVRFQDIMFAANQIRADVFQGSVDGERLGVYGHSFGAIATQIAAGQFVNGFGRTLAVPRLKGAIALSPSPPRPAYADERTAFSDMACPMLHLTGTQDDAPNGDFAAPARRIPFDRTRNVDQWLMILQGANHFTFGGSANPQLRGQSFGYSGLEQHHALIRASMLAFFQLTLNDATNERAFLDQGIRTLLAAGDVWEAKRAA